MTSDSAGLLDSNILIYAHLEESPFYRLAKDFLEKETVDGNFAVAIQNLTEFYAVLTNPKLTKPVRKPSEVREKILQIYSSPFFTIIRPQAQTLETLTDLLKDYPVKGADIHDVHLAATMIDNGVKTIYTADEKIFRHLGLTVVNPL